MDRNGGLTAAERRSEALSRGRPTMRGPAIYRDTGRWERVLHCSGGPMMEGMGGDKASKKVIDGLFCCGVSPSPLSMSTVGGLLKGSCSFVSVVCIGVEARTEGGKVISLNVLSTGESTALHCT